MEGQRKIQNSIVVYMVIVLIASLPVACNYSLPGEDMGYWCARVEEVKTWLLNGEFHMMSSQELLVSYGGEASAINSTLWLLPMAILQILGFSMVNAYRVFMLLCNMTTVVGAFCMVSRFVDNRWARVTGTVLLVLCPYRVYFCYDEFDLGKVVFWMLLPYAIWGLMGLVRKEGKIVRYLLTLLISTAGMLYADAIIALMAVIVCVLIALLNKCRKAVVAVLGGGIVFLPGAIPFLRYILKGVFIENYFVQDSIMTGGYTIGKLLSSFAYEEKHPGLGLGIVAATLVLIWVCWCRGYSSRSVKWVKPVMVLAFACLLVSLQYFPWDYLMRVHGVFLRGIALLEDTTIFVGGAGVLLSLLGAYGVECVRTEKNEFVSIILPLGINLLAAGIFMYLCNMLIYTGMPV